MGFCVDGRLTGNDFFFEGGCVYAWALAKLLGFSCTHCRYVSALRVSVPVSATAFIGIR